MRGELFGPVLGEVRLRLEQGDALAGDLGAPVAAEALLLARRAARVHLRRDCLVVLGVGLPVEDSRLGGVTFRRQDAFAAGSEDMGEGASLFDRPGDDQDVGLGQRVAGRRLSGGLGGEPVGPLDRGVVAEGRRRLGPVGGGALDRLRGTAIELDPLVGKRLGRRRNSLTGLASHPLQWHAAAGVGRPGSPPATLCLPPCRCLRFLAVADNRPARSSTARMRDEWWTAAPGQPAKWFRASR